MKGKIEMLFGWREWATIEEQQKLFIGARRVVLYFSFLFSLMYDCVYVAARQFEKESE